MSVITLTLLNKAYPTIGLIRNLLTKDECEALIAMAEASIKKSEVVDPATGTPVSHEGRSSSGTWCPRGHGEIISKLETNIALLTGTKVAH